MGIFKLKQTDFTFFFLVYYSCLINVFFLHHLETAMGVFIEEEKKEQEEILRSMHK